MNGILQNALAGLGAGVQGMAQGYMQDERRVNMEQQLGDIQEQREMRIAQARENMRFAGTKRDIQELGPLRRQEALDTSAATARQNAAIGVETAPLEAARQTTITKAQHDFNTNPDNVRADAERARKLALANYIAPPGSTEKTKLAQMELEREQMLDRVYKQYATVDADDTLDPKVKEQKLTALRNQAQVIKSRNHANDLPGVKAVNPELDTKTVVTETPDPSNPGAVRKETYKEVRRPGAGGGNADINAPAVGTITTDSQGRKVKLQGGDWRDKNNWVPVQPDVKKPAPAPANGMNAKGAMQAVPTLENSGWGWNGRQYKNQKEAYTARAQALGLPPE